MRGCRLTQGFVLARRVLDQLSHISSPYLKHSTYANHVAIHHSGYLENLRQTWAPCDPVSENNGSLNETWESQLLWRGHSKEGQVSLASTYALCLLCTYSQKLNTIVEQGVMNQESIFTAVLGAHGFGSFLLRGHWDFWLKSDKSPYLGPLREKASLCQYSK